MADVASPSISAFFAMGASSSELALQGIPVFIPIGCGSGDNIHHASPLIPAFITAGAAAPTRSTLGDPQPLLPISRGSSDELRGGSVPLIWSMSC
ncbi:hypothetical protein PR202_gb12676 [Eleusine coracana subsp. coracana]|uniref:Uncharacterized protein n=1 Tax=Eleusine coracana subsp. coracana TaxID=191504 RepID=A0AAV5ERR2_ELECO|nr:hypothetical protein PR202_gb12676 [Eleusine coracana subsp. coracana]